MHIDVCLQELWVDQEIYISPVCKLESCKQGGHTFVVSLLRHSHMGLYLSCTVRAWACKRALRPWRDVRLWVSDWYCTVGLQEERFQWISTKCMAEWSFVCLSVNFRAVCICEWLHTCIPDLLMFVDAVPKAHNDGPIEFLDLVVYLWMIRRWCQVFETEEGAQLAKNPRTNWISFSVRMNIGMP